MKILAARVENHPRGGALPELEILVDRIPEVRVMLHQRFARDGFNYYIAEEDGYYHYLAHNPRDETGMGGAAVQFQMNDGTSQVVKGPWSSNQSLPEALGFEPGVLVTISNFDADPAEIFEQFAERVEALRSPYSQGPRTSSIIDTVSYHRWLARYREAGELGRRFHHALYTKSANPFEKEQPRRWEAADEQYQLVYELSLLQRRGQGSIGTIKIGVIDDALQRLLPNYTLYRQHGNKQTFWVIAQKGVDRTLPEPRCEGLWGYAIHDEHGYPKSRFFQSLDGMAGFITDMENVGLLKPAIPLVREEWRISKREGGRWNPLTLNEIKQAKSLGLLTDTKEKKA